MAQIFLNNGHHWGDPGARHMGRSENEMTIELGSHLLNALRNFGTIRMLDDRLNLKRTIEWINQSAQPNDLAISTHFNSGRARGTEVFYANLREREIAKVFAKQISEALGIPNRGAKSDRWSYWGRLGFLRNLKCDSILIEVCYLTSNKDMLMYSPERATRGFVKAFEEIFPEHPIEVYPREDKRNELERKISFIRKKLHALQELIWKFQRSKLTS